MGQLQQKQRQGQILCRAIIAFYLFEIFGFCHFFSYAVFF
jgi:hypothetical protein